VKPRRDRALWVVVVLTVCALAVPVAYWLFKPDDRVYSYGPSMDPTMRGIDAVDVDFDAYDSARPSVGEIVALQGPPDAEIERCVERPPLGSPCGTPPSSYTGQFLIKRVVAEPGDRVAIAGDGRVVRNGRRAAEPYVRRCSGAVRCGLPRPIAVPPGHYYVLGDNRPISLDSRTWGPVALSAIDGRVALTH
jgi:signal peptidase I